MPNTLTVKNIRDGYKDPRWQGFGYLGERKRHHSGKRQMDAMVLKIANEKHWCAERFFRWMNSTYGRRFACWANHGVNNDLNQAQCLFFNHPN